MKYFSITAIAVCSLFIILTSQKSMSQFNNTAAPMPTVPEGFEVATLGAGCFWCVEVIYDRLDGVHSCTSGYTGGHVKNPTYEDICTKKSGHVEVVQVVFDPKKITYTEILDWFWKLHDPTQANGQGNDIGPQYRTEIFFHSEEQKAQAEESKSAIQKEHKKPIATAITKAEVFYPAEIGHQEYYKLNGNKNPYCKAVIAPKLKKLNMEEK